MTASFLLALILVGWFAGGIARAYWLDLHIPFSEEI